MKSIEERTHYAVINQGGFDICRNYTKPVIFVALIFFAGIFLTAILLRLNIQILFASSWLENQKYLASLSSSGKVVCYLTIPGNDTTAHLSASSVDPNLCTHVIIGFASVVNCTINLGGNDKIYKDAINLKSKNPQLKVMVSVAGMNEISTGFPVMVRNHANRKKFIRSVLAAAKSLRLDGLDIDWEFPAWLDADARQKIHFVQLLYELKRAFTKRKDKLVLSAAVAASEAMIDQCYNVPEIAEHVDFVNLMAYDYHFYAPELPFTGLNAPLYRSGKDAGLFATMNVNYSANYWVMKGMPRNKIVVGIPTYGHSFKLQNVENHGLQAPCSGYGLLGYSGFASYPTICGFLNNSATRVFENSSQVPYAYKATEWISYDDIVSVSTKANWIRSSGFGGAMIFSLNADDWNATWHRDSTFPLTRAVANIIRDDLNETNHMY
ncbi:chitinase-3-like protein 2 isoform X1 [Neodiprion virginianus]|uniref:chitinase-3-like protein 2 isoform X1 n=1 Tax=Neodiprion fabricii TaxID=2872261 RepID=UPI001ED9050A|nr:chitinase-3-like protein 2 isoform X1 [Neodiprion fabricii]XP_046617949.1 chitinase-3-like protein 2 isoform X1 [Neodiprion virginianus]